jgi:hypothetical protein
MCRQRLNSRPYTCPSRMEKFRTGQFLTGYMSTIKTLCLSLVSIILTISMALSASGQTESVQSRIELQSWVDQSEVPFNRELTFIVEAGWEGEQERFSITPVAPPQCDKLEILGTSSVNETKIQQGVTRSLKIFKFTLRPTETGAGRIGSIELSYIDNFTQDSSSLVTQPISVQVTPPVKKKLTKYQGALIVAFNLVLAYLLYSVTVKRRRVKMAAEEKPKESASEEKSLENRMLQKLDGIRERIRKGELETFSSDAYRLLADYLEAKYQIITAGKTTDDIVSSLSTLDLASESIAVVRKILSTCDLMKFAKDSPEKEKCEQITASLRRYLEQNR